MRFRISVGPPADSLIFYNGLYFDGKLKVLTVNLWRRSVSFWADFR